MINAPQVTEKDFSDIDIIDEQLPKLEDIEKELVAFIQKAWGNSVSARQNCNGLDLIKKIKEVEKADRLEHQSVIKNKPKYRSKIYLPWIRKVHLAITAYFTQMMLSGEWHDLSGQTNEDQKNAEYMSNVVNYLFENDYNFRKVIVQSIYQVAKKGMTAIKGFWQVIYSFIYDYEPVIDPITQMQIIKNGKPQFKKVKNKVKRFNDVVIEYIDINDFQFWPTYGKFEEAIKIHQTKTKYSKLRAKQDKYLPGSLEKIAKESGKTGNSLEELDINLKECWINNEYINGQELSNCIVLVANDSVVLEYKTNPYDYGVCPFIYTVFNPIEGSLLGTGSCFFALDLQDFANLCVNIICDCAKIGAHPIIMAPESADPDNYVSSPGAWWPIKDQLFEQGKVFQPFAMDLRNLPITFESLGYIRQEFNAITIPEQLKGVRPERDETLGRDMMIQEAAEINLQLPADNINNELLKPILQLIYILYYQRAKFDTDIKLKIAKLNLELIKITQQPVVDDMGNPVLDPKNPNSFLMEETEIIKSDDELLAELGDLIPLDKINVSIMGYKNNINKQITLNNINTLFEAISNYGDDTTKRKFNVNNIIKKTLRALDLDINDTLYNDDQAIKNELKEYAETMQLEADKERIKQQITQELIQEGVLPMPIQQGSIPPQQEV